MIQRETLLANSAITPGMVDKLLCFKTWYMQWRRTGGKDTLIEDAFTKEVWDAFIMEVYDKEREEIRKAKDNGAADSSPAIAPPPTTTPATIERSGNGLNVSYK
eukprot:11679541-Ditylum_brightwellii.AAC.1